MLCHHTAGEPKQLSIKMKKNQSSVTNLREDKDSSLLEYLSSRHKHSYESISRLPQISKDKRSILPSLINEHAS